MRPDIHTYFMYMARLVSTRGTCARRRVGTVLVDADNFVLATGYNGVASKLKHCIDEPCPGAKFPSGEGLELCRALHSEPASLLQCKDVRLIRTVYCTTAPCISCTKLFINTGAEKIYFDRDYPQANVAKELWLSSKKGRKWVRWKDPYGQV